MAEIHLSSLVVHARPNAPGLAEAIAALGAEIHAQEGGKYVVTLETTSSADLADAMTRLQLLDGVFAATLVFHHVEPRPDSPLPDPLLEATQ